MSEPRRYGPSERISPDAVRRAKEVAQAVREAGQDFRNEERRHELALVRIRRREAIMFLIIALAVVAGLLAGWWIDE